MLIKWFTGAAICIAVMAVAAYSLIEFGLQRPRPARVAPPPPAPIAKAVPASRAYRVTPESEIITELNEEAAAPAASAAVPTAPPARPLPPRPPRAIAAAPVRPAPGPAPALHAVRPAASPAASAPSPAPRPSAPADLCPGQTGIAQAMCLSRRCADPGVRASRQCADVRETERKLRERLEQGG